MPRVERPLDGDTSPLLAFADDLRRLRTASNLTYRQLAQRAHYSPATLSEAASGRKLPTLAVTLAYVRACGGDEQEWTQRWRALAVDTAPPPDDDGVEPPYVGLAAFQTADADRFFGRERLVGQLTDLLTEHRLVAVWGASGAGKSSLLRAGLLPHRPDGTTVLFAPGAHPLEECAVQLARLTDSSASALHAELCAEPRALHRTVRQVLAGLPVGAELLLVIDQFEEIFTLCADGTERSRFVAALVAAAEAGNSGCRTVLGVRADFALHCAAFPDLAAAMEAAQVTVGPMSSDELRRAITGPAARGGYAVESALLAALIADAHGRAGALPLLSHALLETWRRRRGNTLTLAGYQAAGDLDASLARTAEDCYHEFSPAQRVVVRRLLVRLTALGDGTEDTKRRVRGDEAGLADPDTRTVVERLTALRLLTVDRDSVEITHESLIRSWPRLHDWLNRDRNGLRVHRRLTEAAAFWRSVGSDPGALYRGAPLEIAREWATSGADGLSADEYAFLDASLAAQAAEAAAARRRSRRLRQLVAMLTALCVVTTGATVLAVRAQQAAARQRDAVTADRAADRAEALRTTSPAFAAQLSLAAYRLSPTLEARSSVLSSFATPYATPLANVGDVDAAAFRPDGRLLATGGRDHMVRLWDLTDPHRPRPLGPLRHTDPIRAIRFTPDGTALAAAGDNGTVRRWELTGEPRPQRQPGLPAPALAPAGLAPDGLAPNGPASAGRHTLAAAEPDGTLRLWDATDAGTAGGPHRRLRLPTTGVAGVALSADGRTVATAGADHRVRLWDIADSGTPRQLAVLSGHTDAVRAVAFGPNGRTLVSAGVDATVRLWSVADPRRPRELAVMPGHTTAVTALAVSPDGRTILSTGTDRTGRMWDVSALRLVGHESSVYGVAIADDGRLAATGGYDRSVRLWDVAEPERPRQLAVLRGHTEPVNAVAFRPGVPVLASGSHDGTVRLWDVLSGRQQEILHHPPSVEDLAISPDGRLLATAGYDGTVRLFRLTAGGVPGVLASTLTGHTGSVEAVAFGPRGTLLATGGADRTIQLWEVADPHHARLLDVFTGNDVAVKTIAFSPDERLLAAGGEDGAIRLWDVNRPSDPVPLATLSQHADGVMAVAFTPDSATMATASSDRTVRLWDVRNRQNPRESAVLTGHGKAVDALAFTSDGRWLATGGEDWITLLWDLDVERVAERICACADPLPLRSDWATYFPGLPYRPPCPA